LGAGAACSPAAAEDPHASSPDAADVGKPKFGSKDAAWAQDDHATATDTTSGDGPGDAQTGSVDADDVADAPPPDAAATETPGVTDDLAFDVSPEDVFPEDIADSAIGFEDATTLVDAAQLGDAVTLADAATGGDAGVPSDASTAPCNMLTHAGCADGDACYFLGNGQVGCYPAGGKGEMAPCTYANDCAQSLVCVALDGNEALCRAGCDVTKKDANHACKAPANCLQLNFADGDPPKPTPAPDGLGVCG